MDLQAEMEINDVTEFTAIIRAVRSHVLLIDSDVTTYSCGYSLYWVIKPMRKRVDRLL